MALYKATSDGYAGRYVRAGETFELDGPAPSWAVPVRPVTPSVEKAPPLPEKEEDPFDVADSPEPTKKPAAKKKKKKA